MTDELEDGKTLWLISDQTASNASLATVVDELDERGINARWVTISEALGTVARGALAEGAERIIRSLRITGDGQGAGEDFLGALQRKRPDILVVTDPRYARALAMVNRVSGVESLQVGLIDEFGFDDQWISSPPDCFIVPTEPMEERLRAQGIPGDAIFRGGPSVDPRYRESIEGSEEAEKLGLAGEHPVVLVRASGFASDRIAKLIFQCSLVDGARQFIFHHDGDRSKAAALRRSADEYGLEAAMFGSVSDLERYVAAADRVVASAQDPLLPELLSVGTPMMVVDAGPGQALGIEQLGVAEICEGFSQLGTRLDDFISATDEDLGQRLAPWDAEQAAQALLDSLEAVATQGEALKSPTSTDEKTSHEEGEAEEQETPFESIGVKSSEGAPSGDEKSQTKERAEHEERSVPASLTRAEAKEQLASLILEERDIERQLTDLEKQQRRWRDRLELSREWKEDDLVEEAADILEGYIDEVDELEQRLSQLRRQKAKLKDAARRGSGASEGDPSGYLEDDDADEEGNGRRGMEDRFRKMEVDRDLEGLKDRIRRELGE